MSTTTQIIKTDSFTGSKRARNALHHASVLDISFSDLFVQQRPITFRTTPFQARFLNQKPAT